MPELLLLKPYLAVIAAALAVVGNVPYLRDVLSGRVTPHPYTWLVWAIVSGTVFFGQYVGGAGWAAIPFAASEIFTIIIFLFSLKYGFKKIPWSDTYYLAAALLGLIPWWYTHDPTWSVVIMVTIDCIAFIPTIKKTWRHPHTESPTLYASNLARHILALLALSSYNIATTFHSIAMIITNTLMVLFMTRKKQ
jgi:hypothetical protein